MTQFDVVTPRLRLLTMTTERMDADLARSAEFPALLGAEVPTAWPPEHWEPHVFVFMKEQIARQPETLGWNRYVVLREPRPVLIGNVCAFPRGAMEAEIGYALMRPWQRLGLATEAVRAFVAELRRAPGVQTISAQTLPELTASIGVLERCGFAFVGTGDEERTVRYRLRELAQGEGTTDEAEDFC